MHRQIHEHWAFGFLTDMDGRSGNLPMNDRKLVTKLEIVLDSDGNVDKVALVRASGVTSYDMAAIDTVYAAAPYPTPPAAILSGNRKVYIHWTFHRNEEACGTPGVEYFILDNGKPDSKADPLSHRRASG
jgi:TonB family protein